MECTDSVNPDDSQRAWRLLLGDVPAYFQLGTKATVRVKWYTGGLVTLEEDILLSEDLPDVRDWRVRFDQLGWVLNRI
jgi:hypothetical protein